MVVAAGSSLYADLEPTLVGVVTIGVGVIAAFLALKLAWAAFRGQIGRQW